MKRFWNHSAALSALLIGGFACSAGPGNGSDGDDSDGPTAEPGTEHLPASVRCEESKLAPAGLRRLTANEFQASVAAVFPEIQSQWGGVALGVDPVGLSGFTTDSRSLLVGPQSAEEIFRTALEVASIVTSAGQLETLLPCSSAGDSACAGTFIDTYGPKLYRRALSDADRSELVAYFDSVMSRSDFSIALKWTLVTMLQSPFFVYRSELGDDSGNLDVDEIATQLAYTFSGAPPTEELLAQAQAGELEDPQARVIIARQLLETPGGRAVLEQFFAEWSGYEQVRGASKDDIENFAEVREAMVLETRAFLTEVVTNSGGDVRDLLTAPYTFTNDVLAGHYGFGEAGAELALSDRPDGQGVGLLAQGSLLSSRAHPNLTSPIFRGIFVFEKLLCGETPPVPDFVPSIEEAPPADTTRERFERSHSSGPCSTCHAVFEPYGYAFEQFDQAGRYRADENGFTIDTSATIEAPEGTELSFSGQEDLSKQLAAMPLVTDCVSGQMAAFAYSGAGGEPCLAEEQRTALQDGLLGLLDYYANLAGTPSMTTRAR